MFDIESIEKHYNFNRLKVIKDFKVKGGRKVLLIQTENRKYIVKIYSNSSTEDKIDRDCSAILFLNKQKIKFAPQLILNIDYQKYTKVNNRFLYILEYIEGKELVENSENFYNLGKALFKLHQLNNFKLQSTLDYEKIKTKMLSLLPDQSFKKEYDDIIHCLPTLKTDKHVFIHTDITCFNAKYDTKGNLIFLDFDDAGMGSKFIDIAQPLITQFVRFDHGIMKFNKQNAIAFYKGYQFKEKFTNEEKELIFQISKFMQLIQIPWFGKENEIYLWQILKFGINHKHDLKSCI